MGTIGAMKRKRCAFFPSRGSTSPDGAHVYMVYRYGGSAFRKYSATLLINISAAPSESKGSEGDGMNHSRIFRPPNHQSG